MKESAEIRTCDNCKKEVTAKNEMYIGGHPFSGWVTVNIHGGPTDLMSLSKKKDFDFCSLGCMRTNTY